MVFSFFRKTTEVNDEYTENELIDKNTPYSEYYDNVLGECIENQGRKRLYTPYATTVINLL